MRIESPRNTNSAVTSSGRSITNVPNGGRNKKLKMRKPSIEATMPGPTRPRDAAITTMTTKANPTVLDRRLSRNGTSTKASAIGPTTATT